MRGSKRKLSMNGFTPNMDPQTGSSRFLISNRARLVGGLPPPESEIPSGHIEDYQWLIGTHHRDFDDQQIYKTTKIYIMRVNKTPFIVADRVWLTHGRYSGKGDCNGIHVRDIERYTRAYMREVQAFLVSDQILSAQTVDTATVDVSTDSTEEGLRLNESVLDMLLPAYITRDSLCQYMLDACVVVGTGTNTEVKIPTSHKNALRSTHKEKWLEAEASELASLASKGVFLPTVLPQGKSVIDTRWVFALKYKNGEIARFKARLVAKGFEQIAGIDFDQTFSPVARMASLRLVLALSAIYRFEVHQMDVDTAFLNADLEEEVYIRAPEGYTMPTGCNCIRLKKALYGLKQAPRAWNKNINDTLHRLHFRQLQSEPCLYLHYQDNDICIISLYVDDLVIAASSIGVINHVKSKLQEHYLMKDLGVIDEILGCKVCVDRDLDCITIHQTQYMKEIIQKFLPADDNITHSVPADPTGHLVNNQCATSDDDREFMRTIPYRQAVGSLLWLALCTRPDISYAVGQVAKFNANPGPDHWKAVLRIFRYLKFTGPMGIVYRYSDSMVDNQLVMFRSSNAPNKLGNPVLFGYSDANFARDIDTRRSTSGFIFMLAGAPISWQSRAQATVALSSTEAEYIALAGAAQEAIWFLQVLREFKFTFKDPVLIYEDNQSAIKLVENPVFHKKSKHVDIKYHFVRELVENRTLAIQYVSTVDNIADIFTKPLSFREFTTLRAAFLSFVT